MKAGASFFPEWFERLSMTGESKIASDIDHANTLLRAGELVAFPTETVYGLGADASNASAVKKIFDLKGRPSTHPVIVHIASAADLTKWARDIPADALKLAGAFWPGPFTLVLKRALIVSDAVTGGQDTVAVRVPRHPIAQRLLQLFGRGIAAPSANRFGHVSPTLPSHVRDEFGDSLFVVDGADCEIGLESTIVSCVDAVPRLLRPGGISLTQLRSVVPGVSDAISADAPRAPGLLEKHYSPDTPISLVSTESLDATIDRHVQRGDSIAVLATRSKPIMRAGVHWIDAGNNAAAYGHSLYANLRALDKLHTACIVIEAVPTDEVWQAVRDRLQRAAAR
jgi:L-threonylcarbamoyladenylate synthase